MTREEAMPVSAGLDRVDLVELMRSAFHRLITRCFTSLPTYLAAIALATGGVFGKVPRILHQNTNLPVA